MAYNVVLKTTEMGAGEKALTQNLMNAFIHQLTEQKEKPKNIIMYAEGVNLAKKGSDALNDLIELEKDGVNVLSCGICVDYYELNKKLGVGGITTMPEVVDLMSGEDNVVYP
ncbi:sulfurtransferase-like selenium metabolism protein YedF [Companilactobacillus mishanensis]|uniref:Sulfurtransferase-like selenium metabolism protein YedF n=1 Tax=Companilactobacillus mishanensis TaxID=2486008 RepID=A0A5P0ZGM4_9LACO|nr:sulfurtransferase-like selenium metabolism protein YedF [Companilactobacillus mishanensis]MQS43938.1 sulfurtransferase-like selenium metabolism protein YedF [Companilactobacillus mishanensis]MQS52206.1 sulfurtransferase-like selenium metabolism protein YedF [Companilactobacillus mishanensis]MQS88241.1 sulfurtransferase-like selenium metabolism protein YedF [Companilactobacillus mishanensis]